MRPTTLIPTLLPLMLLACDGAGDDPDDTMDMGADTDDAAAGDLPLGDDDAMADLLWDAVQGREDWDAPPRWDGVQNPAAGSGHGTFVQITANDTAIAAWGDDPMPSGSIIVKRTHDQADGSAPTTTLYAMWKVPDYQPNAGGWFWAVYRSGEATTTGAPALCTNCHGSGDDLVRASTDSPRP